eukprot:1531939-Ditylum_brightwellii.AAC.1
MMTRFLAPGNNPTVDDELFNILYQMIKVLEAVKQKSETIIVNDDTEKQKKSSSQRTKSAKAKANAK